MADPVSVEDEEADRIEPGEDGLIEPHRAVYAKVEEEMGELQEVLAESPNDRLRLEDEFGDVLFAMVNYARFLGVDPETALERSNRKFKRRFEFIETQAVKPLQEMSLEEMDALWNEAKTGE